MNIAFVTYEYPPETGGGGIGTYVVNAARMLHRRGHHVEIFAGGDHTRSLKTPEGVPLHRVQCSAWPDFKDAVLPVFSNRYRAVDFDVVEGPEYNADALRIQEQFPDLPVVVKLHTSSFMLYDINIGRHLTTWDKARFILGGLRRGYIPTDLPWEYTPDGDVERRHTRNADVVAAPSASIRDITARAWGLDPDAVLHFPYPFEATAPFLNVPVDTDTDTVTFIGRLEMRKGVLDLADAIPHVLDRHPDARFQLVGRSLEHPRTDEDIRTLMERRLAAYDDRVDFLGLVPYETIPDLLTQSDVCVFPSLWENFPNVCLEAMTAARGVVGSARGGMAEMLDDGRVGNVVEPGNAPALADAILDLLNHPDRRKEYGAAARQRVLDAYSFDAVGPQQEACYEAALDAQPAA